MNAQESMSGYGFGCRIAVLLAWLSPSFAYAHVGTEGTSGLAQGLLHPLSGLDHLAAMLAVGLWAAQRGGRALWVVPLTFIGVMAVGGVLGINGVAVPLVEPGIAASVLVLGVLVAAAVKLPLLAGSALVGLFAIFHGHAHGAEMPEMASALAYGAGFLVATAVLHGVGIVLGLWSRRRASPHSVRYAGGAIAALGCYLMLA